MTERLLFNYRNPFRFGSIMQAWNGQIVKREIKNGATGFSSFGPWPQRLTNPCIIHSPHNHYNGCWTSLLTTNWRLWLRLRLLCRDNGTVRIDCFYGQHTNVYIISAIFFLLSSCKWPCLSLSLRLSHSRTHSFGNLFHFLVSKMQQKSAEKIKSFPTKLDTTSILTTI